MTAQCKAFCSAASYQMKSLQMFFKKANIETENFAGVTYTPVGDGSAFFFSYGCVVFWKLKDNEIAQIFKKLKNFEDDHIEKANEEVYNLVDGNIIKVFSTISNN